MPARAVVVVVVVVVVDDVVDGAVTVATVVAETPADDSPTVSFVSPDPHPPATLTTSIADAIRQRLGAVLTSISW